MVDARFEKLDFDEDKFVIKTFELTEETVDEGQGIVVRLFDHVKADKTSFKILS